MQQLQNLAAQAEKFCAVAQPRARERDGEDALDAAGARGHQHDAVAHVEGFVDVVRDEEHGGAAGLPEAEHFVLQAHAGEGVERAERFVEEQDFRMVDERAGEGHALGHAAGEMMGKGVGETFQSHEAHELVHLAALFVEHAAGDEAGLDIAAHGEPREKIRVLENEAALGARRGDGFGADPQLPGVR